MYILNVFLGVLKNSQFQKFPNIYDTEKMTNVKEKIYMCCQKVYNKKKEKKKEKGKNVEYG